MMNKAKRATLIVEELCRLYPDADCTLDFKEPWKLMISGILAAQCTDARVNKVTPILFAAYPGIQNLADADTDKIQEIIRSCGFFRVKAKSINKSMRMLLDEYESIVPQTMDELLRLPGIGRKIANLILGDCYGIPSIVVDTHCGRISHHLGLTDSKDPYRIEKDLSGILPRYSWIGYGHRMVAHGRAKCTARNPGCSTCTLQVLCRKGRETLEQSKQ